MSDQEVIKEKPYVVEKRLDAADNVCGLCPVCGDVVYEWETECTECGQKLKWE